MPDEAQKTEDTSARSSFFCGATWRFLLLFFRDVFYPFNGMIYPKPSFRAPWLDIRSVLWMALFVKNQQRHFGVKGHLFGKAGVKQALPEPALGNEERQHIHLIFLDEIVHAGHGRRVGDQGFI